MSKVIWSAFIGVIMAVPSPKSTPVELRYPSDWPAPRYDTQRNPLTLEGIRLGRKLFYDPLLSRDSSVSCSSCHLSYTAFTHVDHALSHGIGDSIGTRNSPVLINLAWSSSFMWDGAINHLDVQALAPISNPVEMGSNLQEVVHRLRQNPEYLPLFFAAYNDREITGERVLKALAQFQLTLISDNSKYDQVRRGAPGVAFTAQEQHGYELFLQHCNGCHTEPLFTNGQFAANGLAQDTILKDIGRQRITGRSEDSMLFKVPALRNVEYSFPYMHDGRFKKLTQVVNHYQTGGYGRITAPLSGPVLLSSNDKTDIVAFLLTLSDRTFVFNPDFAYPFPK